MAATPGNRENTLTRRRTLLGGAAVAGAGVLGAWGVSRLATAEPAGKADAKWRADHDAGAEYDGIHKVMQDFMVDNGVRAGTLSVRAGGELRLSSGYTWAAADYPTTKAASRFRLASVSKAFTCAVINRLAEAGAVDLDEPVFPFLGITTEALPSQTKDPKIDTVTVRQLVDNTGGWDREEADFDPAFQGRNMARELGLDGRVGKRDIAEYMYGEPLQNAPGSKEVYSNFGHLLLGLVAETATGSDFIDVVTTEVMAPLGVADEVLLGETVKADAVPGEVTYDHAGTGLSAWKPYSEEKVPHQYGAFLIAEGDASGGLVATSSAVTALISENAVWGLGDRAAGYYRTGAMAGTQSRATSRKDGVDWCFIFNNRVPDAGESVFDSLGENINAAINASDIA